MSDTVTHKEFGGGRPLCGWMAPGDKVTSNAAKVTCSDCQDAQQE